MLAAELLRLGTPARDAARHPAPAVFSPSQRSRLVRHSRRRRPLEAVRRPALASGSQHTSEPVHLVVDAPKPKSRAGSQLSLPSRSSRTETALPGGLVRYLSRTAPCAASGFGCGAASLLISIRQPVSRAANRAFCPSLPIASDSWKSGTTTRAARPDSSMTLTDTTLAGDSALATNRAGSSS